MAMESSGPVMGMSNHAGRRVVGGISRWRGLPLGGRTARLPRPPATSAPVDHASRTGWGRTVRPPCDGGHGPEAAARNPQRRQTHLRQRPVPLEGGLGERPGLAEAVVGRLVEPGVERGRPSACPTAKPAAARPTAFSTVLRPRASRDDLQAEGLGTDSVLRPSSRQPAPSIAAMALSGVSAVTGPDCGGSP